MPPSEQTIVGNVYDKYGTRNPVARLLMRGFLASVSELYASVAPRRVLEVGCGEGRLAHHLVTEARRPEVFDACDLALGKIAEGLDPLIRFREASVYDLPFPDRSYDLVVCCEVLEHLDDPARGLREIARVTRRFALLSTPREPLWRALNVMRGKYLPDLGNTPGHVQHWSSRGLVALARRELRVVAVRRPLPWTVVLGERP